MYSSMHYNTVTKTNGAPASFHIPIFRPPPGLYSNRVIRSGCTPDIGLWKETGAPLDNTTVL